MPFIKCSEVDPRAASDKRLRVRHFRVLIFLGQFTARDKSWTLVGDVGRGIGHPDSRAWLTRAIEELMLWGYVERGGHGQYRRVERAP